MGNTETITKQDIGKGEIGILQLKALTGVDGDPSGIRTRDLHRDRVACLTATPWGHEDKRRAVSTAQLESLSGTVSDVKLNRDW